MMPASFNAAPPSLGTRAVAVRILAAVLLVSAAHIAYCSLARRWYAAELTIAVPGRSIAARMLESAIGIPTEVDVSGSRIVTVLGSNSLLDRTIEKFELRKHFKTKSLELTREALIATCEPTLDVEFQVVTLRCEVDNPSLARDLAEYMAEQGNELYRRISRTIASDERAFLEGRVDNARRELDEANGALRQFAQRNGLVDLDQQAGTAIATLSQLEGLRISKRLTLAYLSEFASAGESQTQQVRAQLRALDKQMLALEQVGGAGSGSSSSLVLPAQQIPTLLVEKQTLERDAQIKDAVYRLAMHRYELARVAESRDTAPYQIIDHATVSTRATKPNVPVIIVGGVLVGILVGVGWCFLPWWWQQQPWFFRWTEPRR